MLLVLVPARTDLESLVKLHLAALELLEHRKGGLLVTGGFRGFLSEHSSVGKRADLGCLVQLLQ